MIALSLHARGMFVGGLLMLVIGVGHIFLPAFGYPASVLAGFDPAAAAHFHFLVTYALCAFFLTQGVFSLWLVSRKPSGASAGVAFCLASWWWWRLCLEAGFPVEIPIFGIARPTIVLTSIILAAAVSYTAALVGALRWLRRPVAEVAA
jgi:hypothetical protein